MPKLYARRRFAVLAALTGLIASAGLFHGPAASAALPTPVSAATARGYLSSLKVAPENRTGYKRDLFPHWITQSGTCNTRETVLKRDGTNVVTDSACAATSGSWYSPYDGATWTAASDVDIDHLVPLAEAWDSGARRWTAGTRTRYANDLRDPRPLVAVTDNVNQSKSDQDPAEWMPELGKCRYLREWVAVKIRWRLTVNRPEKQELRDRAANCKNTFVTVRRAKVVRTDTDGGGGTANCAPGYSPCVPPPPPDLDCSDLDGPIKVTGSDPHHLDGDGDGWACES